MPLADLRIDDVCDDLILEAERGRSIVKISGVAPYDRCVANQPGPALRWQPVQIRQNMP